MSLLRAGRARLVALALSAALSTIGTAAVPAAAAAAPAAAPCAALNKTIGGEFRGNDGRRLSGLVGVVLIDASGREIDRNGCPSGGGYAFTDAINADPSGCCALLPLTGAAPNDTSYEDRWQIAGAPANAVTMWVEGYPKSKEDVRATPYSHYGGSMRRQVPASSSANVHLPRTCATGGDTATIAGSVTKNGHPAAVKEVIAFSRAPEGQGILGFVAKPQAGTSDGRFEVPALARDQRYALRFDLTDGTGYWYEHDYGQGLAVTSCGTTSATFDLRSGYAYLTGLTQPFPDGPDGPAAPAPKQRYTHGITGSYVPVAGDFRGLGREDILWYSAAGADAIWRSTGDGGFQSGPISVSGSFAPLVGDFDGDEHDDIYWFSPTGGDALYRGTSDGFTATYPNSNGDYRGHVGDFNGDGRDDIYWFSTYGGDAIYYGTPTGFTAVYPNANGQLTAHVGDFNGDGTDDIYWFSPTHGDAIYYGQTSGFTATYPNSNGDFRVLVGDYDADDISDIYWFSASGGDAVYFGNPGGFTAVYPNANGAFQPFVLDLDASAGDDLVWYGPGSVGDATWLSTGSRSAPFAQGPAISVNGTYDPVVGQFDSSAGSDVLWYTSTSDPDSLWHG